MSGGLISISLILNAFMAHQYKSCQGFTLALEGFLFQLSRINEFLKSIEEFPNMKPVHYRMICLHRKWHKLAPVIFEYFTEYDPRDSLTTFKTTGVFEAGE